MSLPIQSEPIFEKYHIDKQYHVTKEDRFGHTTHFDEEKSKELLDSNYFSGSICFTRDANPRVWLHKLIFFSQWLHSHIFRRKSHIDPHIIHSAILLSPGRKNAKAPNHPFLVAHAAVKGIRVANRDYLHEKNVTELIVYRPVDEAVRELYKQYAETTAFVKKAERRTFFSPSQKARYSGWDMFVSLFHNIKHTLYQKRPPLHSKKTRRTAYLVTDFLLQNQILDQKGKLKPLFCTAYAIYVLQGTLLLHGLRERKIGEIARFIHEQAGPNLSRDKLAKKVQECFEYDHPNDPVAHDLWEAFQSNKLFYYDSRYAMSAYTAELLDSLSTRVGS